MLDPRQFAQPIAYEFRNPALLVQALTHRSFAAEHNERLEFLGDAVLSCAIARLLFEHFRHIDEGDLSRVRSNLVRQQTLADIGQQLHLSDYLRLGEGELKSGGASRPSIIADALEAVFGAVLLDGGFDAAYSVIARLYQPLVDQLGATAIRKDAKTELQEQLQGRHLPLPVYKVLATHGAAHDQLFEVECTIARLQIRAVGRGANRRAAEQDAAQDALAQIATALPARNTRTRRVAGEPNATGATDERRKS
ncbi:ribonuclease III [Derxia lacustris]|uniref:ribonuclease III n=1 Tax=Derxia lacustris TaxID=764842 RepID=UPI000A172D35|nr:ribonuclease III [Derxia lacustris]